MKFDALEHIKTWKRLVNRVDERWYSAYASISGIEDKNYIPEDIYYTYIEPCLNREALTSIIKDKNLYDKYYTSDLAFPATILRNINGEFYNGDYNQISNTGAAELLSEKYRIYKKIIVKPSIVSGTGVNVRSFIYGQDDISTQELDQLYIRDYLVQENIQQHDYFSQFNANSLNTVRVHTYRSVIDNSIHVHSIVLKYGAKGMIVDNPFSGGRFIRVGSDGSLGDFSVDKHGLKNYHPDESTTLFSAFHPVPKLATVIETAKKVARQNYFHRILGIDLCIDKNSAIRIVDINNFRIGLNSQMVSGSFFKEDTAEIIEYCRPRIKSIKYHFKI